MKTYIYKKEPHFFIFFLFSNLKMAIETILIINKSGGLIYQRNFTNGQASKLNSNDYLIMASTIHGVFAIASQLTPKAIQLSQSNVDYTIPYIPNVGVRSSPGSNESGGSSRGKFTNTSGGKNGNDLGSMGSFKGDDFFKEPFVSWNKSGLRQLSTDQFTMYIYQTLTGLKFVAISSSVLPVPSGTSDVGAKGSHTVLASQVADNFLRKIYCLYSDYVMKDPFYSMEMPIKSEYFDKKVKILVDNLA